MKSTLLWLFILCLNFMPKGVEAQAAQPSTALTSAFGRMYPDATKVEWREKTENFTAFFERRDHKCEAKFSKSGDWLSTEETIAWDSLPTPIQDAFKGGSYAGWNKRSAYTLSSGDGTTQYHLVVFRSDLGRKILIFSKDGKLLKDH